MSNSIIQSVADKVLSDSANSGSQSSVDMLYVGKNVVQGVDDRDTHDVNTKSQEQEEKNEKEQVPPITGTWPYNPQIAYLPGEITKVVHELGKSPIDKEVEQQQIALASGGIVAIQAMATMQQPTPITTGEKKSSDPKVVGKVAVVA